MRDEELRVDGTEQALEGVEETAVMSTPYGTTTAAVRRAPVLSAPEEASAGAVAQAAPAEEADAKASPEQVAAELATLLPTARAAANSEPAVQQAPCETTVVQTADAQTSLDRKPRRRWPLWVAAVFLLVLVGVGAGGYAYAAY